LYGTPQFYVHIQHLEYGAEAAILGNEYRSMAIGRLRPVVFREIKKSTWVLGRLSYRTGTDRTDASEIAAPGRDRFVSRLRLVGLEIKPGIDAGNNVGDGFGKAAKVIVVFVTIFY
jgi:hypothetical protein